MPAPFLLLFLLLQILPYLLLFVYFGSLVCNLADIFTGKTGLGTNTTIVMAAVRWVGAGGGWWRVICRLSAAPKCRSCRRSRRPAPCMSFLSCRHNL